MRSRTKLKPLPIATCTDLALSKVSLTVKDAHRLVRRPIEDVLPELAVDAIVPAIGEGIVPK